jgi:hypothetical protein
VIEIMKSLLFFLFYRYRASNIKMYRSRLEGVLNVNKTGACGKSG